MLRFLNIAVALIALPGVLSLVPLNDLFPYGPSNGDTLVPKVDDGFSYVRLNGSVFNFFNNPYRLLFVNNNGGISFGRAVSAYIPDCGPQSTPMIMPYWADVNTEIGGNVYYRETSEASTLQKATVEVRRAFPGLTTALKWMFIATWDDTAFFGATPTECNGTSFRNTFQTILVTDEENKSFVMFFFNKIQWTAGTASGGDCFGRGGIPATSGFDLGDNSTLFSLPGSCTPSVAQVTDTTNVDQPGKWIFRVDRSFDLPGPIDDSTTTETYIYDPTTSVYEDYTAATPVYEDHSTTPVYEDHDSTTPVYEDHDSTTPVYEDYHSTTNVYEDDYTTSEYEEISSTVTYSESTTAAPIDEHCDITSCQHSGHCFQYSSCNHHTKTWERRNCSKGLFWNPHHTGNATSSECRGSCDLWDNLAQETKDAYRADENCFPYCFYHEAGECSGAYLFHPSNSEDSRQVEIVHCPVDHREGRNISLVWVQDKETCDFCYNAQKKDGSSCCSKYDDGDKEGVTDAPVPASTYRPEPVLATTSRPTPEITTPAPATEGGVRHIGPGPEPVQPVNMTLRPGEVKNFTITVELTPYPLDFYFLFDVSGSMGDDKANVVALSSSLISTLGNLTNDFRIGFGAYSDKTDEQFTYMHLLRLTNNTSTFQSIVNATPILFGGDFPEDAATAMIQSVICKDKVGWRTHTRKMLMLVTDATFHVAGDSAFKAPLPFDMQCHLNNGNYTEKLTRDYPTMDQLVNTLNDNGVTALFGIVADQMFYQGVADRLVPKGGVGVLNRDSSNIIELIKTEYNKIASRVELSLSRPPVSKEVGVTFFSDCKTGGPVVPTSVCTGLPTTGQVEFTVQIGLSTCPADSRERDQVIEISVAGLPGTVEVPLHLVC